MKSLRWAAAGAAVLAAGLASNAYAWPNNSFVSNMMPYDRGTCLQRANAAMASEGWQQMRPANGVGGQIGVAGHKEPSSGYILCLDMANMSPTAANTPVTGVIVVVFVSTSAPNAGIAADEISRLQQRMLAQ